MTTETKTLPKVWVTARTVKGLPIVFTGKSAGPIPHSPKWIVVNYDDGGSGAIRVADAHDTPESAIARIEEMKAEKIKELEAELARVRGIDAKALVENAR